MNHKHTGIVVLVLACIILFIGSEGEDNSELNSGVLGSHAEPILDSRSSMRVGANRRSFRRVTKAVISSLELQQAEDDLRGFAISRRGVPPHKSFRYAAGEFPRVKLEAELIEYKKVLSGHLTPILLKEAFKRVGLSDAELIVAVRSARRRVNQVRRYFEQ